MTDLNVKAIDDGYGDSKCDSTGVPFLIPSFVTKFRPKPENDFEEEVENRHSYIAAKVDNQDYIVGESAYKLDQNIKWVGGENKHLDPKFPIILKTCLGLMANQQYENIDTLTMGLPIKFDNEERIEQLQNIVLGNKHVVDLSFDGINYMRRNVEVKNLIVKSQPFGSLCDIILDRKGDVINKEMAKGFNIIVDIGARTLNILAVDTLDKVEDLTTHTNDGMFTAYQEVAAYLEQQLDVTIPDGKLPQIIQSKELNGFDLTQLIEASYRDLSHSIFNTLEKLLINSKWQISSIIFTGGGSELLRPYLNELFKGHDLHFLDRYSTVKGLRKYGIRQTKKEQNEVSVRVGR